MNKGGKKGRREKNSTVEDNVTTVPFAKEGQQYGIATKMLGSRRLLVKCENGKEQLAIIPGRFKGRKNWVSIGMLVLLNIRDFQADRSDVIYIYNSRETTKLKNKGELNKLLSDNKIGIVDFGELDENNENTDDLGAFDFSDI